MMNFNSWQEEIIEDAKKGYVTLTFDDEDEEDLK